MEALLKEVKSHTKNQTLGQAIKESQLPADMKPIPLDILLSIKRDGRYKARAIVKGYRMTEGVDYNQTFAPIPCFVPLRWFLSVATALGWDIDQNDVTT